MFQLYFKHLLPNFQEWREPPFTPWGFGESAFLSVLSFFESDLLNDETFSLKNALRCQSVFMDSGAYAATSMGFTMDPFEVAEMHALLKADLIVPLDRIILEGDSSEVIAKKIQETIHNTEILLDYQPSGSEVVGPLQGLTPELIEQMFDAYRELGLRKFALGGLVFQSNLNKTLERIKITRKITKGFFLHIFGKFLHPKLLKPVISSGADSVDGYGYILRSVRGFYIHNQNYQSIGEITEDDIQNCICPACKEKDIIDFQRRDRESQYLLIIHNIHSLIQLKNKILKN